MGSGTHNIRLNHILIKTEMSRPLPFILSLMEETSRTTLLFSSPMENLFLINISTLPVCPQLMRSLMEQHVLLLDGARISLEPQDNTRWFSRRLIFLLSTMESVKTSSEPPDLDRSSNCTFPSCVLVESMVKTLAREMEAVLLSAPPSTTPTPMFKLVLWPGVLAVVKMELLEFMLMLPRPPAGLILLSLVTMVM